MRVLLTAVRVSLTAVRMSLTAVRVSLTAVRMSLTAVRVSLTTVRVSLTAVRVSLTAEWHANQNLELVPGSRCASPCVRHWVHPPPSLQDAWEFADFLPISFLYLMVFVYISYSVGEWRCS